MKTSRVVINSFGKLLNHSNAIPTNVLANILHFMASDPPHTSTFESWKPLHEPQDLAFPWKHQSLGKHNPLESVSWESLSQMVENRARSASPPLEDFSPADLFVISIPHSVSEIRLEPLTSPPTSDLCAHFPSLSAFVLS